MRKFIKGTLEIAKNVNLEEYEKQHSSGINLLSEWTKKYNVRITIGVSDDNTYLCEYKIVANTSQMCKSLLSELKEIFKQYFYAKPKSLLQLSGNIY